MYNKGLLSSAVVGLTGGSILGQLVEMKFVNLNLAHNGWNRTSVVSTAIRIILTILFQGIFIIPYFFISTDVPVSQLPYLWCAKYFLPSFLSSFLLFAFGRLLFFKLKLVNERTVGRMFEFKDEDDGEFTASKQGSNSLEFIEMEMAQKI